MSDYNLVGVTGYAGAGKDEFAISLELRAGFRRMAMSDPLLEMATVLNPLLQDENGKLFEFNRVVTALGYTEAKKIPAVRQYLQVLGTDAVRNIIGNDAWVRAAEASFVSLLAEGKNVVITGIRFSNEAAMIKAYGGTMVKVVRRDTGPVNGHVSDTELDTLVVDEVIYNYGTRSELAQKAQRLINERGW